LKVELSYWQLSNASRDPRRRQRLLRAWRDHWHGAVPDRFMTHIAIQEADESGSPVTWGEHVTDEEYGAGA
jgi:hypothetical protein